MSLLEPTGLPHADEEAAPQAREESDGKWHGEVSVSSEADDDGGTSVDADVNISSPNGKFTADVGGTVSKDADGKIKKEARVGGTFRF